MTEREREREREREKTGRAEKREEVVNSEKGEKRTTRLSGRGENTQGVSEGVSKAGNANTSTNKQTKQHKAETC